MAREVIPKRSRLRCWLTIVATVAIAGGNSDIALGNDEDDYSSALLDRAFDNYFGQDHVQLIRLESRSLGGKGVRILTLQIVRSSEHGGDRTLIRFLEPPVLRGTAFLTIDESPRNTVTYAFLPELKLVRRIVGTERSGPFFGTDLSIEDMEVKSSTDFRARVTEKRDGCVLIAFEPRSRDVSGYDEMMSCVEENQGVFRWIEFLVGGEVRKRLVVDADQVQVIDGRKIPFVMTIRDLQRRTETTIRTIRYEMPESVPEQVFSVENLRRGTSDRDRASALGKR